MLVEMKDVHELEPNRFCYSAVIKALAKGGQWKRSLQKLDEMRERGLSADPVVYTAAIGACEKVRGEMMALRVCTQRCMPFVLVYNTSLVV